MNKSIEEKISNGRQYRDMIMEIRTAEDGSEEFRVGGYASTFDDPYCLWKEDDFEVWEQVDKKAFEKADMEDVILQYNHEGRVFARKSNDTLTVEPDDHGLYIEAFLGGTEIGRQLYEEIKGGYTNKMSFGFTVTKDTRTETKDRETGIVKILRTINEVGKLYDVSAVSFPANDGTSISARSYSEGVIAEVREEIAAQEAEAERLAKIEELRTLIKGVKE